MISTWNNARKALEPQLQEIAASGKNSGRKAVACASVYYSARFGFPLLTYWFLVREAKNCATAAEQCSRQGVNFTADEYDVLATVCAAYPASSEDWARAQYFSGCGLFLCRKGGEKPHTVALLHVTFARCMLVCKNVEAASEHMEAAVGLLSDIRLEEAIDREQQLVRVLKGIALLKFELGDSTEGEVYLNKASDLAHHTSADQLWKIRLIKFRLGLWFS